MEIEEIDIKFGIEPKIIYSLYLLKDKRLALSSHYILILNPEFSKIIISIKNKHNQPIYEIIQLKNGYLISAEDDLIKVYSIFDNYYNLISIYKGDTHRIYKLRELSNGNIAYSSKYFKDVFIDEKLYYHEYSKFFIFNSLNFRKVNINCRLNNNYQIINFIEMNKKKLILLCAKIKKKKFWQDPRLSLSCYKLRFCYFYIKILEKTKPSLWELKDKNNIETKETVNYFVTRETMKIIEENYLLIAIGGYLYIYHFNEVPDFILFKCIGFYGYEFIQCLCPFTKDILALGSWSGNLIFINIKNLFNIKIIKKKICKEKIRNLLQLKDGNIICIKDEKENKDKISLIKSYLNFDLINESNKDELFYEYIEVNLIEKQQ